MKSNSLNSLVKQLSLCGQIAEHKAQMLREHGSEEAAVPPAVQVHRRYGVLHSPQTSSSVIAYLLEYLPCSVLAFCLTLRLPERLASSSWIRPKVAESMIAG